MNDTIDLQDAAWNQKLFFKKNLFLIKDKVCYSRGTKTFVLKRKNMNKDLDRESGAKSPSERKGKTMLSD